VSEQFKVLVTGDDPESLLVSNMFPGRAGCEVLQVSMGKEYIDVLRAYHRFKKKLNIAVLFRLLAPQYPLFKTLKGVYL
jgi:hypothetical protein